MATSSTDREERHADRLEHEAGYQRGLAADAVGDLTADQCAGEAAQATQAGGETDDAGGQAELVLADDRGQRLDHRPDREEHHEGDRVEHDPHRPRDRPRPGAVAALATAVGVGGQHGRHAPPVRPDDEGDGDEDRRQLRRPPRAQGGQRTGDGRPERLAAQLGAGETRDGEAATRDRRDRGEVGGAAGVGQRRADAEDEHPGEADGADRGDRQQHAAERHDPGGPAHDGHDREAVGEMSCGQVGQHPADGVGWR